MKEVFLGEKIKKYEKPKGLDVRVRSFYFRHAEKANAAIVNTGGTGMSRAAISEKGREESVGLGKELPEPVEHGYKIAWSKNPRTLETIEAMAEGYLKGEERRKFTTRKRTALSEDYIPKPLYGPYVAKWEVNKKKMMEERGIKPEDFKNLSPTEQAEIAEKSEEPVVTEWIDNPESELAKIYPPETAAAHSAVLVRRDANTPERLKSSSAIDFFRGTHKTVTEPLLMRILLDEKGKTPEKLSDIGGALGLNDGWELDSFTDENGEKKLKIIMYRADKTGEKPVYHKKEFGVDSDELNRLADLGVKLEKEKK